MKYFEELKPKVNHVYQNSLGIQKNFTVGELKRLLNKFPEDTIICKSLIDGDNIEYSSVEVLTYMRKQDFIDFKGAVLEGNILTIY